MRPRDIVVGAISAGLLLSGCGSGKTKDAGSAQARACRSALSTVMDTAFAKAGQAVGEAATQKALSDALIGKKPKECDKVDDDLGARMVGELQSAFQARQRLQGSELQNQLNSAVASASPSPQPS